MTFHARHVFATGPIFLVVTWAIQHSKGAHKMSKGKRILLTFGEIFIPFLPLNPAWPYGSGA
jgi:hypothetical protein